MLIIHSCAFLTNFLYCKVLSLRYKEFESLPKPNLIYFIIKISLSVLSLLFPFVTISLISSFFLPFLPFGKEGEGGIRHYILYIRPLIYINIVDINLSTSKMQKGNLQKTCKISHTKENNDTIWFKIILFFGITNRKMVNPGPQNFAEN